MGTLERLGREILLLGLDSRSREMVSAQHYSDKKCRTLSSEIRRLLTEGKIRDTRDLSEEVARLVTDYEVDSYAALEAIVRLPFIRLPRATKEGIPAGSCSEHKGSLRLH